MSNLPLATNQYHEASPMVKLFDELFNLWSQPALTPAAFNPAVDLLEHDNRFEIQLSVPGTRKEDLNIEVQKNNLLVVSGSRQLEEQSEGKKWHRIETQYGSFTRTFTLPEHSDVGKIEAEYTDGILHIHIPKDTQKISTSKIAVK